MKRHLVLSLAVIIQFCLSYAVFAQRPNLGTAYNYVLFSSNGAVSNTGTSILTGNVGNNIEISTAFGNVNGIMQNNNAATKQCAADLLTAYNQLKATIPTRFPSAVFGNGDTITAGVYAINSIASLSGNYTLNAKGDPNALFIIQIQGAFSTDANSQIKLINGAKACNVFWKIEGAVDMAANTIMKGTMIVNNAAIKMASGVVLEGRALTTTGAVTINNIKAKIPLGFGLPILTGPDFPALGSTACFTLFSGNGEVSNSGVTYVTGDIGTNVGLTAGFNDIFVTGTVHPKPDVSTNECAKDLGDLYTYLYTLPHDIELLYPIELGHNLELTPHKYLLNAETKLTDTLFFNAQGTTDAVFVMQVKGAFSTTVNAKIVLLNGAQAKNIFWVIDGAVNIAGNSTFNGTIVANMAAVKLSGGVVLNGRAFTTKGSLITTAITARAVPSGCNTTGIDDQSFAAESAKVYPNPSTGFTTFEFTAATFQATQLSITNVTGVEVKTQTLLDHTTKVDLSVVAPGIYFYKLTRNNTVIQSGKLVQN